MYHRLYASKYRQEIISLVWDFLDQLTPGDPIAIVLSVEVIVSSGTDANPDDMIFHLPVLTGSVVEQQIRRGIPGTIYTIIITVETVGGDIFEDVCYLAILPTLGELDVTIWETTQLYPLANSDSMQGFTLLQSGKFSKSYVIPPENIQGFTILQSGTLTKQVIVYNIPPEFIQGFTILVSGHLVIAAPPVITYIVPHEDIQGFTILVGGHLIREIILYTIPVESLQGFTILHSGNLS